ncbi:HWE histidine kinase domain-containing protein [Emcibacter sp. SYSU 3D8]|uniref:sensor histidine kinase n=1 Tax=Emcibacter sp. SYSU 3D8 TaxID=3133969 RepID=UPI0031FF0F4A
MWVQRVSENMHARPGLGLLVGGSCLAIAIAAQFVSGTPMAFMLFYPAILLVAFFAGRPFGYASVVFSAVFLWFLYVPAAERFAPSRESLIGIVAYVVLGVLITTITGSLTRALVRLAVTQREAERARDEASALMSEMGHRRRNELMLVDAIARSVTPRTPQGHIALREFSNRIRALASSGDLLTREAEGAPLAELIEGQIRPFCPPERVRQSGPPVMLSSMAVRYLGMALHELCTNATKHGALSVDEGLVDLTWSLDEPGFNIKWTESGGPPVVPTESSGFGRKVLTELVPAALEGSAQMNYAPGGVEWTLASPPVTIEAPQSS